MGRVLKDSETSQTLPPLKASPSESEMKQLQNIVASTPEVQAFNVAEAKLNQEVTKDQSPQPKKN
ncbi:hypothetical protein KIN20_003885 [Parelaphostrongylus tenuis]|uniref:Uncharacterized protein n=1 Tax=Parelaphostrongylus tenuis TaxID=148309 RepID=A0AAD5MQJ5_PARTN|nr:hypothetical protein KIN20_003885 [Parelaphostrongylus tenuis]